jgi:hypothetical protein
MPLACPAEREATVDGILKYVKRTGHIANMESKNSLFRAGKKDLLNKLSKSQEKAW